MLEGRHPSHPPRMSLDADDCGRHGIDQIYNTGTGLGRTRMTNMMLASDS